MKNKRATDLLIITGIIILAFVLRFYRITINFPFSGEVGDNLLAIKNDWLHHAIPLIGPPTSHPWLYFGPLFYWMYGPVLILSGFNPLSYAYFGALMSVLTVIVNYLVIKYIFNTRAAIISSFLMAISPLFLFFSWGARFFSFIPLLSLLFLYCLFKILRGEKKYAFWLGLVYGVMFSFHYTPLMLFPFLVTVILYKHRDVTKSEVYKFFVGLFIPSIPFLIYDVTHGASMLKNLILWIPYRVAGFFGIIHKNTVTPQVVTENVHSISQFFITSFVPITYILLAAVLYIFIAIQIVRMLRLKSYEYSGELIIILMMAFWGIGALFIHGNPPIHYFVPVLFVPVLLLSIALSFGWHIRIGKILTVIVLAIIFLLNIQYYFSDQWSYRQQSTVTINPYNVPYTVQEIAAHFIVKNAQGRSYILHRTGSYDKFEYDYAQNYIYLLWWYGNEPVNSAKLTYTIIEDPSRLNRKAGKIVFDKKGIIIQKNEKK